MYILVLLLPGVRKLSCQPPAPHEKAMSIFTLGRACHACHACPPAHANPKDAAREGKQQSGNDSRQRQRKLHLPSR